LSLSVFRKAVADLKWQVFWYGIGLAAMAALIVFIYPSYKDQLADFEIPEALQGFIGDVDYGTPTGFVSAEFFSWLPIITAIFAIMAGTSALAGEEANGTLELVLAQPLSRRRLALLKMAAFAAGGALIAGLTCLGWAVSLPFVDMDVPLGRLVLATFNLLPITLVLGFAAMWLGVALPNGRTATGLITAVAVVSYFLNYLASVVAALEPIAPLSVFYYYDGASILDSGLDWPRTLLLVGLCAAFALATLISFERRDIGVQAVGRGLAGLLGRA